MQSEKLNFYVEVKLNSRNFDQDFKELDKLLRSQNLDLEITALKAVITHGQPSQGWNELLEGWKIVFANIDDIIGHATTIITCIEYFLKIKKKLGETSPNNSIELKTHTNVYKIYQEMSETQKNEFIELIKEELKNVK